MNVATMIICVVLAFMAIQWAYTILKNIYNAPKGSTISFFKGITKILVATTLVSLVVGGILSLFVGAVGAMVAAGPLNIIVAFWIFYTIKNGKLIL